ncbi:MAG TPA: hypothetical protein VGE07_05245 [Herpetosiphonaceae bacterium]
MTAPATPAPTSVGPARPLFEPFRAFELDMLSLDQIRAHISRYTRIIDWLKGEAFTATTPETQEDIDEAINLLGLIVFSLESWAYGRDDAGSQAARRAA